LEFLFYVRRISLIKYYVSFLHCQLRYFNKICFHIPSDFFKPHYFYDLRCTCVDGNSNAVNRKCLLLHYVCVWLSVCGWVRFRFSTFSPQQIYCRHSEKDFHLYFSIRHRHRHRWPTPSPGEPIIPGGKSVVGPLPEEHRANSGG